MLTADQVLRIHSSLEPAPIAEAAQLVCFELLGPCEIRLFTLAAADQNRFRRFGGSEDAESQETHGGDEAGFSETGVSPADAGRPIGDRQTIVSLNVEGSVIGALQVTVERPIEPSDLALLRPFALALAVAVRNAQTLEYTKKLTFTDDLTALHNARFMTLYLDREIKRCRRAKSTLSLLFMDLDGFKNINDTHGHLAGSRTLIEVGAVLEKTVRDADVLIRYGGDEFVILFPETPLSGGLIIAERIRHAIEATRFLESQKLEARVSASIGIAAYPESADDVRALISSADQAMYQAKALGKNRVVVARPLRSPESTKRP